MKKLFLILLVTLNLISCAGYKSATDISKFNIWSLSTETILPLKSFVKLNSIVEVMDNEAEARLIGFSSASGFWVAENKVVTAAHFCDSLSIKMAMIKKLIFFNRIFFEIESFDGHRMEAYVIKMDQDNDMCMLTVLGPTHEIRKQILKMAPKKPYHGERVYNLAAPLGIFAAGMLPVFEGFYSGPVLYPNGKTDLKVDMYSLPIRQGSSGSPIVNSDGELVGIVIAGVRGFENLGISPRYELIKQFLE